MPDTYTARWHRLVVQDAYRQRIARFGLSALLEPYTRRARTYGVPTQVRRVASDGVGTGHQRGEGNP